MYVYTHLMITIFGIFLTIGFVENKFLFVIAAIFSTFFPDLDISTSKIGRKKIFRPFQVFLKHRGFIHSFTFLLIVCFFLYFWNPSISEGFFMGFGLHLVGDSFTKRGIRPFWPLKWRIRGKMRTGKGMELFILLAFLILDIFLVVKMIFEAF